MTMLMLTDPKQLADLNNQLREFAELMPVTVVEVSLQDAISVVNPHFPEIAANESNQALLDQVGLVVMTDIGKGFDPMCISWSAAHTNEEAHRQLEQYMQPEYKAIRKDLGIDYHWVCLFSSRLPGMSASSFVDVSGDFYGLDYKPECWICELY